MDPRLGASPTFDLTVSRCRMLQSCHSHDGKRRAQWEVNERAAEAAPAGLHEAVDAALRFRRRQPSKPPPAKMRPGRPAPAIGPGTGDAPPAKGASPSSTPSGAEMKPLYDPETESSVELKVPFPVAEPVSPGSNPPVIRNEIETPVEAVPLPENVPVSSPLENNQSKFPPDNVMFGSRESPDSVTVALSDPVHAPKVMSFPPPLNVSVKLLPLPPVPVPENVPPIAI